MAVALACLAIWLGAPRGAWPSEGELPGAFRLSFSGQVNRAANVVRDGGDTDLYFVDNGTSNSRVRCVGTGRVSDDLAIGLRVEVSVAPDDSAEASQSAPAPGTEVDQRWAEVSLASAAYGKLSFGKGETASDSTAEADLSRTDVTQSSKVADIAGGIVFREKGERAPLTSVPVAEVFQHRDGLSRQSRLRYDTPTWYGLSLAGSLVSDRRRDAAVVWEGEGRGLTAAGALAVAEPNLPEDGLQYDGSLSILHRGSGLNLTLSAGLLERDRGRDPVNLYGKLGWIAGLTKLGSTAFGLDYTRSENLPASGDVAWSASAAVVQAIEGIPGIGLELYLLHRVYALTREAAAPVERISVSTVGACVKF